MSKAYAFSKAYSFIMNELQPRAKKALVSLPEFMDSSVIAGLLSLESNGLLTRREVREFLDYRVDILAGNGTMTPVVAKVSYMILDMDKEYA